MSNTPVDRDEFYDNSNDDSEDDGLEYELEPPDEQIIAGEQARAAAYVREASDRAKVDELFKGPEAMTAKDYLKDLPEFKLQFSTKHILIAMTVLAIGLTFAMYISSWALLIILVFLSLASAYGYMNWQEKKQREEWYRERTEIAERQRDERA